jgi:alkylhydroperoxidase family enzyme
MRLAMIDKPKNLMLKMGYRMMQKQFGKVLTPLKIIYARKPSLMFIAQKIDKTSSKLSFEPSFRLLVQTFASMTNGCHFCFDFRQTQAIKCELGTEKFEALANYNSSHLFTARERAALAYIEAATRDKCVSDETFDELKKHFTDVEIVELTWINAAENYYNSLMIPLGIESDHLRELALTPKKTSWMSSFGFS